MPSPTTSVVAPATTQPKQRTLIFSTRGRDAARQVAAEQSRLEAAYLKAFKRKLPVDLFIGSWGHPPTVTMGLIAHATADQAAAVDFLRTNATPTIPSPSAIAA